MLFVIFCSIILFLVYIVVSLQIKQKEDKNELLQKIKELENKIK